MMYHTKVQGKITIREPRGRRRRWSERDRTRESEGDIGTNELDISTEI